MSNGKSLGVAIARSHLSEQAEIPRRVAVPVAGNHFGCGTSRPFPKLTGPPRWFPLKRERLINRLHSKQMGREAGEVI